MGVYRYDAPFASDRYLCPVRDRIQRGSAGRKPGGAVAFMNQLWDRAVEVLSNKADPAVREARFRQLFHEDFDCPGIARFVLGGYWRAAREAEQREFVKLFEDYAVYV